MFDHIIVDKENPKDPHCKSAGDGFVDIFGSNWNNNSSTKDMLEL